MKEKSDRLMPLQVFTVCFLVILVVMVSLGIINQIFLTAQTCLVALSRGFSERSHELSTPLMLDYIANDTANVTTSLLTLTSTVHIELPTSSFSAGLTPTAHMTPTCTGLSLTSQLNISALVTDSAVPTFHINLNTTAPITSIHLTLLTTLLTNINNQLFLTSAQPLIAMPTHSTIPATSVNIHMYSPKVATSLHSFSHNVPAQVVIYYDTMVILVAVLGAAVVLVFVVWVLVKITRADLAAFCRAWLRESLRTLRGAEPNRRARNQNGEVISLRIARRGSRTMVKLLDANLDPYNPHRQLCCPP